MLLYGVIFFLTVSFILVLNCIASIITSAAFEDVDYCGFQFYGTRVLVGKGCGGWFSNKNEVQSDGNIFGSS